MSIPVFAIRPEPGFSCTLSQGRDAGLQIGGEPLFEICPEEWDAPDAAAIGGILIGSANAVRMGGKQLDIFRAKPVHVVGQTTARAAEEAGFTVETVGNGGLQSVIDRLAGQSLQLLRLAGAERVALNLPEGMQIVERTAYRVDPLPMSDLFEKSLRSGGIVILHSAAAARHFAHECTRLEIPRSALALAALGPRISAAAGVGWAEIRNCDDPQEVALLALIKHMCQGT